MAETPTRPALTQEALASAIQRVEETWQLDPQVKMRLRDKKFILEFNNFAAKHVYKTCGFNVLRDPVNGDTLSDPTVFGAILHASLLTHQPTMTEEECDKLATVPQMAYITLKLSAALGLYQPVSTGKAETKTEDKPDNQDPT